MHIDLNPGGHGFMKTSYPFAVTCRASAKDKYPARIKHYIRTKYMDHENNEASDSHEMSSQRALLNNSICTPSDVQKLVYCLIRT